VIASITDNSKQPNGLTVGQEKYIFINRDQGVFIVFKKGPCGIIGFKSSQSKNILKEIFSSLIETKLEFSFYQGAIIALHDATIKSEVPLNDVGKVIDYLSRHGY
jgi:hypothetical protein